MERANRRSMIALVLFVLMSVFSTAVATTDPRDNSTLRSLYSSFGQPEQLTGWSLQGGDPCGSESWLGVSCSDSRVESINLRNLDIGGSLEFVDLSDFGALKTLDLSKNKIIGGIPVGLPTNVTHIDLSDNNLVENLPRSLSSLKQLKHLNLSTNLFAGKLANVFKDMQSLEELDLSYNYFIDKLPDSLASLTNLHKLYLQSNRFTGSPSFLANLPLSVLHIGNNRFTDCGQEKFKSVQDLKTDCFQSGDDASQPSTAPTNNDGAAANDNSSNHKQKWQHAVWWAEIIGIGGGLVIVVILLVTIAYNSCRSSVNVDVRIDRN